MNISSLTNQPSLLSQTPIADSTHHKTLSSLPKQNVADESQVPVVDKRQAALRIVDRTLAAAYEKISSRGQAAASEYQSNEPLTAEKVAGNILGFIERRLQMDVAEGATQEELSARLEAGLSGFKKGFAEASEKLKALSLLSPEIEADIGKTYDLVTQGIDDLRSKFITATQTGSPKTGEQITSGAQPKSPAKLDVPDFVPTSTRAGYANYEYASAREFSFQLTTKEGDKITINASASEGFAYEGGSVSKGNTSVSGYNASYSASQSLSWQVDGDLNEEELSAINDLLGRVNDLAGQFFAGNLDAAFDQAVNLGYDNSQIGSFALNLSQVEIQQVTQAYQTFEPRTRKDDSGQTSLLSERLLPLGNFIKDLLDTLNEASGLSDEPEALLGSIAQNITGTEEQDVKQGSRFDQFVRDILALDLKQ